MGKLHSIEQEISSRWGSAFLKGSPGLVYDIRALLVRAGHAEESMITLWNQLDSLLFNTLYQFTEQKMVITKDDGTRRLVTSSEVRDLADRLLALSYTDRAPTPLLQDRLYDLSSQESFAAMRDLYQRFPIDENDRQMIYRILEENHQLA